MQATRKLARFLRPYWKWCVLAPLFMILEVAMDLMQPRLIQRIIDEGVAQSNSALVLTTGIWMGLIAVVGIVAGMGCGYFAVLAAQNFGADVRRASFAKVQSLSFANLDALETGSLITRLTNDVTQVQEVAMMMLRVMVRVPLLLVGSLIMAVITSPRLSLLFLPLMPFVVIVLVWIINKTYPLFGEVQRRLDALNTVLQENLSGVRLVKAFARFDYEEKRFGEANEHLVSKNIEAARLGVLTMPLMMIALNVGIVAALWFGGVQVDNNAMEVGQIIAFVNYLTQTLFALMMVSMLIVRLSRAEASADRIAEVLDSTPQIQNANQAISSFQPQGRVAFENVSFSYSHDDLDPVLKEISFVVEPGQTVGIMGSTGSGKSSLVQLIPRFYDVTAGRVTIDGVDVRDIDEETLHRTVGIALQETILFSGTIRDNIRYGAPQASEEDVIAAARAAQAEEFINRLPDGYDTELGQRGVNLSGGQKQRLAIARALLIRPSILILDDSTSAVDVHTEASIQAELAQTHTQQTRFIVAQRVSAVVDADLILVLDDGRLVGRGTHDQLLTSNEIYREIYDSQVESGMMAHGNA